MRHFSLALAIAALTVALSPSGARAEETPPLCKALHGLADNARPTAEPFRISVDPAQACHATPDGEPTRAFCAAASTANGLAWRLYDCVNTMAAGPQITTIGEHAEGRSRKTITRLSAKLAHGARLDLSRSGDRYDVVVWAPK